MLPLDVSLNVQLFSEMEASRKISAAGMGTVKPAAVPGGRGSQAGAILGVVHWLLILTLF